MDGIKKSAEQLNRYYDALHENERFLSVLHIVTLISPDQKDEIYIGIIKSELGVRKSNALKNVKNDSEPEIK